MDALNRRLYLIYEIFTVYLQSVATSAHLVFSSDHRFIAARTHFSVFPYRVVFDSMIADPLNRAVVPSEWENLSFDSDFTVHVFDERIKTIFCCLTFTKELA